MFLKSTAFGLLCGVSLAGCASSAQNYGTTANTLSGNTPTNSVLLMSNQTTTTTATITDDGHDHNANDGHSHEIPRAVGTKADFDKWLNDNAWQKSQVAQYESYLIQQLGKHNVPPLHQLLTTARSWQECGFEPYQVPPSELWANMLPTLRLYAKLRGLGILPPNTEIRSVYRSPDLNRCAGGAAASKHLTNGAIDIWVPTYDKDSWQMKQLQNRLCQFWIDGGNEHNFGLGIYYTGAIHLDTQGYRKWGAEFSEAGSPCRYIIPKPDLGVSEVPKTPVIPTATPQAIPLPVLSTPTPIPQTRYDLPAENGLPNVYENGATAVPNLLNPQNTQGNSNQNLMNNILGIANMTAGIETVAPITQTVDNNSEYQGSDVADNEPLVVPLLSMPNEQKPIADGYATPIKLLNDVSLNSD